MRIVIFALLVACLVMVTGRVFAPETSREIAAVLITGEL